MLRETMVRMVAGTGPDKVIANAVLEAFTIHSRVLMHFVFPESVDESDVLATDFFRTSDEWTPPAKPASFDAARRRVGKEIAHLTYDRQDVDPALKGWPVVELGNDILGALVGFLRSIPRDLLGERWADPEAQSLLSEPRIPVGGMSTNPSTPGH